MDRKTMAYLKYSKKAQAEREAALARWRATDPKELADLARGAEMMAAEQRADLRRHVEAGAFTPEAARSEAWRGAHT